MNFHVEITKFPLGDIFATFTPLQTAAAAQVYVIIITDNIIYYTSCIGRYTYTFTGMTSYYIIIYYNYNQTCSAVARDRNSVRWCCNNYYKKENNSTVLYVASLQPGLRVAIPMYIHYAHVNIYYVYIVYSGIYYDAFRIAAYRYIIYYVILRRRSGQN